MRRYSRVISGGTFDHFHKGHKAFIDFQLEHSELVHIGITTDRYVTDLKSGAFESFARRKEQVEQYIAEKNAANRVEVAAIDTVHIPSIWQELSFDGLVVTEDSKKGADMINRDRASKGQTPLFVITVPFVMAEDGMPISSERIRDGIIARDGTCYFRKEWKGKTLHLPNELRERLVTPFGEIIIDDGLESVDEKTLITVGDVTTEYVLQHKKEPFIAVVDLIVQRQPLGYDLAHYQFRESRKTIEVKNPPGQISPESMNRVVEVLSSKENHIIQVVGEEDLLVLIFVVFSPLGYRIFYGQPGKGMVDILVTEEKKNEAYNLLNLFKIRG